MEVSLVVTFLVTSQLSSIGGDGKDIILFLKTFVANGPEEAILPYNWQCPVQWVSHENNRSALRVWRVNCDRQG